MAFTETKHYSISLKSPNGNTVGFINLSKNFCQQVIGKSNPTIEELESKVDLAELMKKLTIEITSTETTSISAEDF